MVQVKIAQYLDIKADSEKDDPFTTTRIYWCLGLGDTAEALSEQATVKHIFRAIFNLAKAPPPPLEEVVEGAVEGEVPAKLPPVAPAEPVPLPPLVRELIALAKASKLDHPSKKIAIMDVLYQDPPPPKLEVICYEKIDKDCHIYWCLLLCQNNVAHL